METWDAYIWKLATKWHRKNPQLELEDILAEVRAGFVVAANKFDPARGFLFSTFATYWGDNLARQFVHREIARGTHVPANSGMVSVPMRSFDVRPEGFKESYAAILTMREPEKRPEFPADFWQRIEAILNPQQSAVIRGRFRERLTLREIGEKLGISHQRVKQIWDAASARIRDRLPRLVEYLET